MCVCASYIFFFFFLDGVYSQSSSLSKKDPHCPFPCMPTPPFQNWGCFQFPVLNHSPNIHPQAPALLAHGDACWKCTGCFSKADVLLHWARWLEWVLPITSDPYLVTSHPQPWRDDIVWLSRVVRAEVLNG